MPFSELPGRVAEVQSRIAAARQRGGHGQDVRLIAVTKTHGADAVEAAAAAGLTDVGENKVQEALRKQAEVRANVRWHLIGHLQSNKVKALTHFALCHAVDRTKLADAVHEVGVASPTPLEVLLQVNVSGEVSKGGYEPELLAAEAERLMAHRGLVVRGVMTMAPFEADERLLRSVFAGARAARAVVAAAGHPAVELSMGMSNDYELAVEEGATMVRLGTVLFGTRM